MEVACVENLGQLWKMQQAYASRFGGPKKLMVQATGKAFWMGLTTTDPPLVAEDDPSLRCPWTTGQASGGTDYWGPAKLVELLGPGDPVGAHSTNLHPPKEVGTGGFILRKSGDVLWIDAVEWDKLAQHWIE